MPKYPSIYATQTDIEKVNMVVLSNPALSEQRGFGFFNWNISSSAYFNFPALAALYRDIKENTFDPAISPEKHLRTILTHLIEIQSLGNFNSGYSFDWFELLDQKKYSELSLKLLEAGIFKEGDHLCKHVGMILLILIALALNKSGKNHIDELTTILNGLPKELESLSSSIAKLEQEYKDSKDETVIATIKALKSDLRRYERLLETLPEAITFIREYHKPDAIVKLLQDLNSACRKQFEKDIRRGIQIELGGETQKLFLSEADFMIMMRHQLKLTDAEIGFIINAWHQNAIPSHAGPISLQLMNQIDPSMNSYVIKNAPESFKITMIDGKLTEISAVNNYMKEDINEPTNPHILLGTSTVKYTAAANPHGITSICDYMTGSFPDINLEFSYQAKSPEGQLDLSIQLPTAPPPQTATKPTTSTQDAVQRPTAPAAASSSASRQVNLVERVNKKPRGQMLPITREPAPKESSEEQAASSAGNQNIPPLAKKTTDNPQATSATRPNTDATLPQVGKPSATTAGYSDPLRLTMRSTGTTSQSALTSTNTPKPGKIPPTSGNNTSGNRP